ncbi:hypothetical protein CXU22_09745 [Akkermansia muciniphila]|uniref:Glycosyltransferase 2-like domain-containing protein n=1 Tax=Akkermansia muciniphila TaxID=239935 RepID=A0A2N8HAP5_9BACT|nr:glycosyltransferase family 2 protein [Akkermansia muciniphila]PNC16928.1 hypothetical protein CXU22_09745 [Akkermansia muciniphila]
MPQISVIIPAYKTQQYIERCIYSVLGQTLGDIEIILVNDSSPDNTLSMMEQIASTWSGDKTIRIISHEQNRGLSAARNTGLASAQGEFIYFLDSDDYIAPNALETLLRLAQAEDSPVTIGGVLQVDQEDTPLDHQICHIKDTVLKGKEEILHALQILDIYISGWNKLVRRDWLLENNILFDEGYLHEDWPWCLRLALRADKIICSTHICYYYVCRPGSITDGKDLNKCSKIAQMIQKLVEILDENGEREAMNSWVFARAQELRGHISLNFKGIAKNIVMAHCFSLLPASFATGILSSKKRACLKLWKILPSWVRHAALRHLAGK